jgi:hypothetical protein
MRLRSTGGSKGRRKLGQIAINRISKLKIVNSVKRKILKTPEPKEVAAHGCNWLLDDRTDEVAIHGNTVLLVLHKKAHAALRTAPNMRDARGRMNGLTYGLVMSEDYPVDQDLGVEERRRARPVVFEIEREQFAELRVSAETMMLPLRDDNWHDTCQEFLGS